MAARKHRCSECGLTYGHMTGCPETPDEPEDTTDPEDITCDDEPEDSE